MDRVNKLKAGDGAKSVWPGAVSATSEVKSVGVCAKLVKIQQQPIAVVSKNLKFIVKNRGKV